MGMGILEQVLASERPSPIVLLPKADGSICICSDYKVTINPVLKVEQFSLPKPEDLFSTLAGGQKFSKLDWQMHTSSRKWIPVPGNT